LSAIVLCDGGSHSVARSWSQQAQSKLVVSEWSIRIVDAGYSILDTGDKIGKPGNQDNRVQLIRITGNQEGSL